GLIQCAAMIPGTSRSAATIIGAMLLGSSRVAAAEFSFFLAIPTMAGATAYTVAKRGLHFDAVQWAVLGVGSVVSFLVALAVVAALMKFIQRHDFKVFGWYRIALALVVIGYFFLL
ncbi:MAG TPA: undecaprenyl-diphosphate phosphatase, partial [Candidatus Bathyarchaeia archaeon]|nr:undecaprenyl-diphosphate phosphatase [Candidatus Bathyarchaeia archaeon]